ncbi:MAG: P-loop NTPase [Clostridia bacterium]|nr:P-loop NTPase [Clostridia bacterium]
MIVAVASGKGGTGKTTLASNLAWSLKETKKVQVLDCDVDEPNLHLFLNPDLKVNETVSIKVPTVNESRCDYCGKCADICQYGAITVLGKQVLLFPELCHGCGGCTLLCPQKAISEIDKPVGEIETGTAGGLAVVQGRMAVGEVMAPAVIKGVKEKIKPLGTVIIDAPPGTSCSAVAACTGVDYCILVTEPTPFGLHDLKLAVDMLEKLEVPRGVVINRWTGVDLVGLEAYCKEKEIPILLRIPFDRRIAQAYAQGRLLVEVLPEWQSRLQRLWESVEGGLCSERTCSNQR